MQDGHGELGRLALGLKALGKADAVMTVCHPHLAGPVLPDDDLAGLQIVEALDPLEPRCDAGLITTFLELETLGIDVELVGSDNLDIRPLRLRLGFDGLRLRPGRYF